MQKIKSFLSLSFLIIFTTCLPIFQSGDGNEESDNSLLLLLGGGSGSSDDGTNVSPEDAGSEGTEAPGTVIDPLQAEAEAILGISFDETFMCYHVGNEGYVGSPVVTSKIQSCLLDVGNNKKQIKFHPVNIDSSASTWFKPWCITPPSKEGLETGIHTLHSDDAVAKYVLNRCYGGYKATIPEPEPTPVPTPAPNPTPEPEPTPDPVPLEITYWGGEPRHLVTGMVYPEVSHILFTTSFTLPCNSIDYFDKMKSWVQLWEEQVDGRWIRRNDVYPVCGPPWSNYFFINMKPALIRNNPFYMKNSQIEFGLNEAVLKPETKYRVLLSKEIYSVPEPSSGKPRKLAVFNSLGDISGQVDQWSGLEFTTDTAPCFTSYADRWIYSETICNYHNMQTDVNGNWTVKRMGCAILTGPQTRNASPPNCKHPKMFPDVVSEPKPDNAIGDYGNCANELTTMDADCINNQFSDKCQKKALKKGICIINAGQPDEFVRVYYNFDSDSFDDCQGIKRPVGSPLIVNDLGGMWGTSLNNVRYANYMTFYTKYRRAGCDGEPDPSPTPDPKPATDPEPTPDSACKNTVSLQTDEGRWFETPKSSYVNAKGKTVKIKGIHTFWQNEPLKLNINACKEGWYKLKVRAKNYGGKKPDFYGAYHLNITNPDDGREYGLSIPASDERYYTRKTFVYLQKGKNELQSLWTNDAYLEDVYDANIQIRAARIVPYDGVPINLNATRKSARQFCQTDGRFFSNGRTLIAESPNQMAKYCFESLEAGEYQLVVFAKNNGPVPEGFSNFKLRIRMNDAEAGFLDIPVDAQKYKRGKLKINIYGATTKISLSWINDVPETEDAEARFELKALRLKKIGPVSETQFTAYLKSGSFLQISTIFVLSLLILGFALVMRRRHLAKS